jgi:hypothetical protein
LSIFPDWSDSGISDKVPSDQLAATTVAGATVFVMHPRDLTLFTTLPPPDRNSAPFVGSIFLHAVAAAIAWFSIAYMPPAARILHDHYAIRQLDLRMTAEQQPHETAQIYYPRLHPPASESAGRSQAAAPPLIPVTTARKGPQTLIQADLNNPVTLPQIVPVPQIVLWSPSKAAVEKIAPPLPEKPTAAHVHPVPDRPNQEINLAEVNVASSNLPSEKLKLAAGTTSPVAVDTPLQVELPPASASQQAVSPTPVAILSLSDIRMKNGTVVLPPISEAKAAKPQNTGAPGKSLSPSSQAGDGTHSTGPGSAQNSAAAARQSGGAPAPQAAPNASTADVAANPYGHFTTTSIALPKNGQFGAVVVGNDLSQEFPELENAWGGRVAYTAYLHVGLSRSWIMQYSLPRNVAASTGGTISRLDAPWPYNIVRPNLPTDSVDSDAVLIRGFVDAAGRFQNLSVVFPQPFSGTQFVLAALRQWQFRPATHDGQPAKVEVLLIIPETFE